MPIPGTLVYEGPAAVSQALIDEIPDLVGAIPWLVAQQVEDPEADPLVKYIEHISHERIWNEAGYELGAIWFSGDSTNTDPIAASLAVYGFDLYDQGSGTWYAFLPSDRAAS